MLGIEDRVCLNSNVRVNLKDDWVLTRGGEKRYKIMGKEKGLF